MATALQRPYEATSAVRRGLRIALYLYQWVAGVITGWGLIVAMSTAGFIPNSVLVFGLLAVGATTLASSLLGRHLFDGWWAVLLGAAPVVLLAGLGTGLFLPECVPDHRPLSDQYRCAPPGMHVAFVLAGVAVFLSLRAIMVRNR